ncbi:toprim domain-containing protein [Enterovibrio norvegicus]|uniref:toprim domain-containing protein n=1 Tax=Enterovibrio norvegicus TaxID=188144 RepID=UPI000C827E59|nr:toprim domain-containing protein [Enterovibrio norvegicus]PMH64576.1 hypothetical protein BCU62_16095 [Enterovibrio norvegicus]
MKRDFEAEKLQFQEAIKQYGWLRILEELTPLDGAISYLGSKNAKRMDICPDSSCSGHQLWKGKGNYELFKNADQNGTGYCYKCQKKYSGFDTLMEFNRYSFKDAVDEIKHHIGFTFDPKFQPKRVAKPTPKGPQAPSKQEIDSAKRLRQKMNKYWSEAVHLDEEPALPAARYFANRGITNLHHAMRDEVKFHPHLSFFIPLSTSNDDRTEQDKEERERMIQYCSQHPSFKQFYLKNGEPVTADMGTHPCLLVMVRSVDGEPRRLHRIYLDEWGNKASFEKAGFEIKKMMPGGYGLDVTGCACYIDPPSIVRGVGEGMETVLAVKQVTQMPMDCAINAGGLKNYNPHPGTKFLYIFEDKDLSETGEKAAKDLETRMVSQGIAVIRVSPSIPLGSRKSVDWLDVLNERGETGFPRVVISWRDCLEAA